MPLICGAHHPMCSHLSSQGKERCEHGTKFGFVRTPCSHLKHRLFNLIWLFLFAPPVRSERDRSAEQSVRPPANKSCLALYASLKKDIARRRTGFRRPSDPRAIRVSREQRDCTVSLACQLRLGPSAAVIPGSATPEMRAHSA